MTNKKQEIEDETGSHGDIQFNEWFERLVDKPKTKDEEDEIKEFWGR